MYIKTKIKISEVDYNKLLQCSKEETYDFIADIANKSPFPACGYGFSSPTFFEEDGEIDELRTGGELYEDYREALTTRYGMIYKILVNVIRSVKWVILFLYGRL